MHASGAVTIRTAASLNIVQRRRGRGGGNRLFSPDEARSDRGGGGGGAQSLTVTTAAGGGQRPASIAWRASERDGSLASSNASLTLRRNIAYRRLSVCDTSMSLATRCRVRVCVVHYRPTHLARALHAV